MFNWYGALSDPDNSGPVLPHLLAEMSYINGRWVNRVDQDMKWFNFVTILQTVQTVLSIHLVDKIAKLFLK